jgi:deoxyadenosine/deoxycytidine kinase
MSHKKISIEGNIGCGKTTVCESVLNNSRLPVFLEPVSDWIPYLDEFYKDPMKWGFAFNVNVILSYQKWKNNSFTAVYERSPLSCKHVFTNQQIKDGFIHPLELNIFNKIYDQLAWEPDYIIYIKTNPSKCSERMKSRGRECENSVSDEYLYALHKQYEALCEYIKNERNDIQLYIVDGNRDKTEVSKDVNQIISEIIKK